MFSSYTTELFLSRAIYKLLNGFVDNNEPVVRTIQRVNR